jgi:hypothetical protein
LSAGTDDHLEDCCDVHIGLCVPQWSKSERETSDVLTYAVMQVIDALVVNAGHKLGYTETRWKLGYQDLASGADQDGR